MSINWVMLDANTKDFIRLPHEKTLITSPARTSLALASPSSSGQPLSIKCSDGKATLTNQRLIYLPKTPTPTLQSLSAPILSLQDSHVTAPFFGANVWQAVLLPTPSGGFPPQHSYITLKLTFQEGGAFDFHSAFERIKEVVGQAAEVGGVSGSATRGGAGADLEQLPAYEEAGRPVPLHVVTETEERGIQRPTPISPGGMVHPPTFSAAGGRDQGTNGTSSRTGPPPPAPDEPPPGYDEVQHGSVADRLERRVMEGH